ncbi:MAG TPA: hypothetical protein PKX74_00030 [Leptospiraceae bacterium]|nr:hypothetical protein [Leptospiraceae bacterium]HMW58033.1 hypothetical protein [Leptospiraceae bacterium]HMY43823.1 hypothetical protein [Leptospiraceae bacterium]HMZ36140.1 hypothetical protein [Leptospiraceae bacterium]HNJ02642.1 hypothetical protein [Leptospiraceae bacterium]
MRIYFDACCFGRPLDDLSHPVVELEARAVDLILAACATKGWDVVSGNIVSAELSKNRDPEKRDATLAIQQAFTTVWIQANDETLHRAADIEKAGFSSGDALHLASAEHAGVDFFLSTDYPLLRKVVTLGCSFESLNPLEFVSRELTHD